MVNGDLAGQAFVEDLCERTLRTVRINFDHGTEYLIDLRNQANAESSTMREYRGRYVFELIQNANDAVRDARQQGGTYDRRSYRVRIQLTEQALIIANDGIPFLEKDVDSIYRWGESSKDPNKSVGYKGIGFKSVLEITESPQIFSSIVQFHFDHATCYTRIRKIVGKKPDLKLPITRFVFPFSVDAVEMPDRDLVSSLLNSQGYSTVIRLPLLKKIKPEEILQRIEQDLDPALLLFLNGIDEIEFWTHGKCQRTLARKIDLRRRSIGQGQDVTLLENKIAVSRWLLFDAPKHPVDIGADIEKIRDNAWSRVKKVGFGLAFPLNEQGHLKIDADYSNLFVYFPTDVNSGLRFRVHADFFIDAARKTIPSLRYNSWLADQIADFLRKTVIPELLKRFPDNVSLIRMLVPEPRQEFAGELQASLLKTLGDTPFVQDSQRELATPSKLLLVPDGLHGQLTEFHRYFPEDELLHLKRGRRFPNRQLYGYLDCIAFLSTLGAHLLVCEDVFKLFDRFHPVTQPNDYQDFYQFLWNWREGQPDYSARSSFSEKLSKATFIITSNGDWIRPRERLYHAKLRFETPNMPRAIKAQLAHPLVYGDKGTTSPAYQLLNTLSPKVRDYDAAEIIRSSIVSLFDKENFTKLSAEERAEIYRYLFGYWQSQRAGSSEIERLLKRVLVPARLVSDRRAQIWSPANETYLSSIWSKDNRLEELYEGLECPFLYEINGLEIAENERADWAQFWQWLGVSNSPRFLHHEIDPNHSQDWYSIAKYHPHANSISWENYIQWAREKYHHCPTHWTSHRYLIKSVTIDRLKELLESHNAQKMILLFQFLAENWHGNNSELQAKVACQRKTGRETEKIIPHWRYVLQNSAWIPAATNVDGDKPEWEFYRPDQCWLIASSEDPIIRSLLPTPPDQFSGLLHRQFAKDIGIHALDDAGLDELVEVLKSLPSYYPDPNVSVSAGKRPVRRALSTLTRWVIGRINNLLIQSDTHPTPIELIPLVVQDRNTLRYSSPGENVFYADDRYHSPRWRDYLPFAPLDDDWRDAAKYLSLKFVSEYVQEEVSPGAIMPEETEKLARRFKIARPFMMALVSDQRESARDETARYLSRLEIQVVKELSVQRKISLDPGKTIEDFTARVFLKEEVGTRAGSSGRAPRTGILYVYKDVIENFDMLGGPIAAYIRIPSLADAFVILLDRGDTNGRIRFLQTRGLNETIVEEMRVLLRRSGINDEDENPEVEQKSKKLDQDIMNGIRKPAMGMQPEEPESKKPEDTPENKPSIKPEPAQKPLEFPAINIEDVKAFVVGNGTIPVIGSEKRIKHPGGGHKPQRPFWDGDQKLRDAYGKRGEELVFLWEIQRLKTLNIDDAEHNVRWLRQEGLLTADHDIESVDIIDNQVVPITIEVKATPGADFRVFMSREELECALRIGKNYRLYRVTHVAEAAPQIYLFENPYTLWEQGKAIIEPRDTTVYLPDPSEFDG